MTQINTEGLLYLCLSVKSVAKKPWPQMTQINTEGLLYPVLSVQSFLLAKII